MSLCNFLLSSQLSKSWRVLARFRHGGHCWPTIKQEDTQKKPETVKMRSALEGPVSSKAEALDVGALAGVYEKDGKFEMTPITAAYDKQSGGLVSKYITQLWKDMAVGEAFVLASDKLPVVLSLFNMGPSNAGYNEIENLGQRRENERWGIGAGVKALANYNPMKYLLCDKSDDAVAEALSLATWGSHAIFNLPDPKAKMSEMIIAGLNRGKAQNWARDLLAHPCYRSEPASLAKIAHETLVPLGVTVDIRDRNWIVKNGMEGFLTVANGSSSEPKFLECFYKGAGDAAPVLLSGLGVTYESGGLNLRTPEEMLERPGSMAGAAVVLGTLRGLSLLKTKLNVRAVIPICENMISGQCMKLGDVVNIDKKQIQIKRTDFEGQLMMADALVYGRNYSPSLVVNVATLTSGVNKATGAGAFACFTRDDKIWECMEKAGAITGDRPWRLPQWNHYEQQLRKGPYIENDGTDESETCIGAAFLRNFLKHPAVLLDITGVSKSPKAILPPYLDHRYVTGRPTRTVIQFLQNFADGSCKSVG